MNCLDDWHAEVVQFCRAKSKYKDSPPLMASPSVGNIGGCAWHDDSFRGAWCKYDVVSGGLVGDAVMLSELVGLSYSLCELIYPKYGAICAEIEQAIMKRIDDGCMMANEEENDGIDHMDGGWHGGCQEIIPEAEAYIRQLYLCLKGQEMVSANECVLSGYFGCRQQCLCGCLCFCLLVFALFHGDHLDMMGIDWVNHVVLNGGCRNLGNELLPDVMSTMEVVLLGHVSEYAVKKLIVKCLFDMVNMKNPSGGMIGPGNCQWLHNCLLFLSGRVGDYTQKTLKNHAVIHDACGFMLSNLGVGAGYGFGYFPHSVVCLSSGGSERNGVLDWFLCCSAIGQVSGLVVVRQLMCRLTAPCFNELDEQDKSERCIMDKHFKDFANKKHHGGLNE